MNAAADFDYSAQQFQMSMYIPHINTIRFLFLQQSFDLLIKIAKILI